MKHFFSLKAVTKFCTCILFFCLWSCGSENTSEQNQVVDIPEVELPSNTTTVALAGEDKSVKSNDVVLLSGVASDSEGTIDGYLWQQISGPTVSIIDVSDTDIQFTSPSVAEATDLEFKITVINNLGTEATDTIVVTVLPLGNTDSSQLYTTVTLQADTEITPHTNELITFALPIAEGLVQDTSSIKVTVKGVEQAIFAKAGLRWHWSDNSIRSVTIQLQNVDMTLGNIELTITNNGRDLTKDLSEQPHAEGWATAGPDKANMLYPRIFALHDKNYLATSGLIPPYLSSQGADDSFEQYQLSQLKQWSGNLNYTTSSSANWLFDRSSAYFKAYMTTGLVEFLKEAILSKQFYFSHVRNDSSSPSQSGGRGCWAWGGVACADGKYIAPQQAKLAWALTGDDSQWDNSLIVDMALQSDLGWNQYGSRDDFDSENEGFTERGAGMAGLAEITAYEMTADVTIYNHMNQRITSLANMQQNEHSWDKTNNWLPKTGGFEHNLDVHEGNHSATSAPMNDSNSRGFSAWMSENIADFLWQSYWITKNQEIPDMLRKLGNAVDLYGFTSIYNANTGEHDTLPPFAAIGDVRTKSCNKAGEDTDLLYFASAWADDSARTSGDFWPYYSDTHNIETVLLLATAYYFEDTAANKTRLSARIEKLISGWGHVGCASVFSNVHRLFNWQHRSNSVRTWQWINDEQPTIEQPPITEPPVIEPPITEPPTTEPTDPSAMVSFEEVSEQVIDFAPIAHQPFWIGMPDVNNDGCPDLFAGTHNDNAGSSQMWLHNVVEGQCSKTFSHYDNSKGHYSQMGSGRITSRYIFSNITKQPSGLPDIFGSDADGGNSVIYPLNDKLNANNAPIYNNEINGCRGGKARCTALDINGDGNIDFIASSDLGAPRRRIYDPLTNETIIPELANANTSGYRTTSYLIVDVDGDSWPDVVAGQSGGYWRYNPDKSSFDEFTFAFIPPVDRSPTGNMQVALDYNNDGHFDLLFGYGKWSGGETIKEFYLSLHRNNGDGTFTDVTKTAGGGAWTDGSLKNQNNWTTYGGIYPGDFNNDGFIDFATMTQSYSNSPRIFQNNGDGTFTLVKDLIVNGGAGVDVFRPWGNVADWDNDGFLDIAILSKGSGDIEGLRLYQNNANDNHWLKIRARGLNNNTDGYHTKFVFRDSTNQQIVATRYLGNYNQADARFIAYAGLGTVTSVDLTVEFPHQGPQYHYANIDVDKELIVFRDGCLIQNWQPGQGWPMTSAGQACTKPN
jgi:hypothetical protein